jgi:hypothetical protein
VKTLRTQTTQHTDPVGVCIYCGSNESLSDEHVIPLSLGGNYILDKASCSTCAGITSAFEGRLARGFMRDARVVGRYPTRRPKERPKSLPLKVRGADTAEVLNLAPAEHPGFLHLPILAPAGRLHGRGYARGVTVSGSETIVFGKDPLAVAKDLNASQMESTVNWDVTSFARLLAKVAYASAVASVGLLPRERVPILWFSAPQMTRRIGLALQTSHSILRPKVQPTRSACSGNRTVTAMPTDCSSRGSSSSRVAVRQVARSSCMRLRECHLIADCSGRETSKVPKANRLPRAVQSGRLAAVFIHGALALLGMACYTHTLLD